MLNILNDKFVLWGLGNFGNAFYDVFGSANIVAVMDNNKTFSNKLWHEIPVISIAEYKKTYRMYSIIVTPVQNNEIIKKLQENSVQNYFLLESLLIPQMFDKYLNGHNMRNDILFQKIKKAKYPVFAFDDESGYAPIDIFCEGELTHTEQVKEFPKNMDLLLVQGLSITFFLLKFNKYFHNKNICAAFAEAGFIYSIVPCSKISTPIKYRKGHSFIADTEGIYFNARVSSGLEKILNSDMELTKEQYNRAITLIKKIKKNKISKYNHQPIFSPAIGTRRSKILVVDQVRDDKSIIFGMADDETTFEDMLYTAIRENPDSDILIKTHPASNRGHYEDFPVEDYDNVYWIDYEINPISLLESVDEVYVCTSQIGFEAVICDKIVHVFGMPFYAGWGVTQDRLSCPRRMKKRTKEEIFYAAYILYSRYVSFKTNSVCELEQTIDEIIELRAQYWSYMKSEK